MEAVWTRYFPLSIYVRDVITSGRVGPVLRVFADNSLLLNPEEDMRDNKHRMVNPDLAGGALLDSGIYSLTWVFQTLYLTQPAESRKPPTVVSALKKYSTGVDEMSTIILIFPRDPKSGGDAHAVASTSIKLASNPGDHNSRPAALIQGAKGEIQVFPPLFRPTRTKLVMNDGTVEEKHWPQPGPGKGSGWENGFGEARNPEGEGHGMFWEADEAASCIIEGRKEGRYEGLDESILIMEVMDEVRRQGGMKLPDIIETTDYPVEL